MKRTHWWIAAALAATLGCSRQPANPNEELPANNPNEADFPGAPGSSVPAPAPVAGGGGGGPPMGNGAGLPSNYPGMENYKKGTADNKAEATKPADESKPEPKADKEAAPKQESKDELKPAAPTDELKPAAPANEPKPAAPKAEPKEAAPKGQ
jgi:hypothetical protein